MKISASIYSNPKNKPLQQVVVELDAHHIDLLHVDFTGNEQVWDDIKAIRTYSKTPIDLHLITDKPEDYYAKIEELGIEYVTLQYENLTQIPVPPTLPGTRFGLAIVTGTPVKVFAPLQQHYSFLLMMCTVPGQSGGTFNRQSIRQIIDFKYQYPQAQIHVDGGVNNEIAFVLRLLGVNAIVSGSYLMNHESLGAGMLSLHRAPKEMNTEEWLVADFAVPTDYLPVLNEEEVTFTKALECIDKYKQGFVLVTNKQGVLTGVISNADVRRALLKHRHNLNEVANENLINPKPVTIPETGTLNNMVTLLNNLSFIVLFLPVTNAQNQLKGAVLLNHLTRV